ncbi:MAG TPA: cell division protein FtsQ/DivIB [Candidatus Binatia bacterium]|nr:cell division protein FtsQ/DivIB [Candidatus Binatia bacterium]
MNAAVMIESEPPQTAFALRVGALAAGISAMLAVVIGGWLLLQSGSERRIDSIQIEAPLRQVDAGTIRATLRPTLQAGLLEVDLDAARASLERLPWVARARADRVWPASVRVRIWERTPYARWGAGRLLDTEARSFTPGGALPDGLPLLDGAPGHEQEVKDAYGRLEALLQASPFALEGLALDARGEWTGRTRQGAELHFGRGAPDQRTSLLLGPAARALAGRIEQIQYIDLRYTNGFAVGWRAPQTNGGGEHRG